MHVFIASWNFCMNTACTPSSECALALTAGRVTVQLTLSHIFTGHSFPPCTMKCGSGNRTFSTSRIEQRLTIQVHRLLCDASESKVFFRMAYTRTECIHAGYLSCYVAQTRDNKIGLAWSQQTDYFSKQNNIDAKTAAHACALRTFEIRECSWGDIHNTIASSHLGMPFSSSYAVDAV